MQSARIMRHSTSRKAEKQIGQAGNGDRRPERFPARGIKEKASKGRLMSGQRQKNRPVQEVLAFPVESRSDAPKAAERGTETLVAKRQTESWAGTERLMEEVCELENCKQALQRVKANKGSPGVDGMRVEELPEYLKQHGLTIGEQLRNGTYQPQPVRRVEIEKPDGGGMRKLGIPTVLDRFVQQAVLQVLQKRWD